MGIDLRDFFNALDDGSAICVISEESNEELLRMAHFITPVSLKGDIGMKKNYTITHISTSLVDDYLHIWVKETEKDR